MTTLTIDNLIFTELPDVDDMVKVAVTELIESSCKSRVMYMTRRQWEEVINDRDGWRQTIKEVYESLKAKGYLLSQTRDEEGRLHYAD